MIPFWEAPWLSGRMLAYGAEGPRIKIYTGPKISCNIMDKALYSYLLHSTQVN